MVIFIAKFVIAFIMICIDYDTRYSGISIFRTSKGDINWFEISQYNCEIPERFIEQFRVITKCSGKCDCLVKEILYIRMRKPTLNVQTDSIRAKVSFRSFFVLCLFCCVPYLHTVQVS